MEQLTSKDINLPSVRVKIWTQVTGFASAIVLCCLFQLYASAVLSYAGFFMLQ